MVVILLIRHGQNEWVKKNRLAGWTPGVHLNDKGRQQVADLGQRLSKLPLQAVYSSPLERCVETAAAVAEPHELVVEELDAVGEVRYGKWEGKKIKKLAKKKKWHAVQHFPSRFRFPRGESFVQVQQRAVAALEGLSQQHKKGVFAVVSHADVIKLVLAHYLGVHMDLFQRIAVSPASVSVLALSDGGHIRVLRVNDSGPLQLPKEEKDEGQEETPSTAESGAADPEPDGHDVQNVSATTAATVAEEDNG
ncbi:MAG: MSMEG_4193 family putative phosphomutase [Candidatus Promineifilaceae bacterium]|nr:MSMEG_4193 family putative phosphomutase [Candidatus Promineifilaceae bacterium]